MTDRFLVPDVVRNLRSPFDSTWREPREPRRADIDRMMTMELIDVLDPVLAGLEVVPAVDEDNPPIDLFRWPDRGLRLMASVIPTLSSITLERVDRRLRELGEDRACDEVEAVGQFWIRLLLQSLAEMILWSISERAAKGRLKDYTAEYLAVVERHIDGQVPYWGCVLADSIAWDVGEPAIPLLQQIAASESLDAIVRQHAARKLDAFECTRERIERMFSEREW